MSPRLIDPTDKDKPQFSWNEMQSYAVFALDQFRQRMQARMYIVILLSSLTMFTMMKVAFDLLGDHMVLFLTAAFMNVAFWWVVNKTTQATNAWLYERKVKKNVDSSDDG